MRISVYIPIPIYVSSIQVSAQGIVPGLPSYETQKAAGPHKVLTAALAFTLRTVLVLEVEHLGKRKQGGDVLDLRLQVPLTACRCMAITVGMCVEG